jgi:benzoate/toluate 1,2-dioxygenase alpha subunit
MKSYGKMISESESDFWVRTNIYTDSRVFEDELSNIFEKTWVYVAHESELPNPGDFVTTYVGRQPAIVSRGRDKTLHVLLNVCRHRGSVVCRAERGNSNFFRCPYHGWVYDSSGALVAVAEPDGYPESFSGGVGGLVAVPRMATYRGLIFASLSPVGETLEAYLGEIRDYIDLWVERSPIGAVRLLRPHKTTYPGNWKFQAEQDTDGYHGRYVHDSAFQTLDHFHGDRRKADRNVAVHGTGYTRGFPRGHCLLEKDGTRGELPSDMIEEYMGQLVKSYGADRARRISMVRHILIYPNVYLMDDHIRVHHPIAVDRTVVHSYFNYLEGVSERINQHRLKNLQWRHSQAGLIGTDDVEMFVSCQSGMQAAAMGQITFSRGLHREERRPSGEHVGQATDETPFRAMYREWARLMNGGES